ncbi:hypothetical protein KPL37_08665 [Clostridium frigoris]|uniref:SpoIIAA-like n=1 Tax=Clostridium frigoris TaxID=205327 RepID=A0ABS6BVF6_9CLOT|nr:hypothetical protein [Clostridium frigoris]MBU3159822.1 hypothetical protein [Clostridium frigoris]
MKVTDIKGKYTLEVSPNGTIVQEMQKGFWTTDDFKRFQADYVSKIAPLVKDKKWAKCCDVREYKTSAITSELQAHTTWAATIGLTTGAIIATSAIVKMNLNRGSVNTVTPTMFDNEAAAISWLESQGYKKYFFVIYRGYHSFF